jgi:pimeloyl-ACP methyl ester carboxylesterase
MRQVRAIEWPLPGDQSFAASPVTVGPDTAFLLHDPGSDVDAWGTLPIQIARDLEIETVALDLPGHGLSDDPWEPEQLPELLRYLRR